MLNGSASNIARLALVTCAVGLSSPATAETVTATVAPARTSSVAAPTTKPVEQRAAREQTSSGPNRVVVHKDDRGMKLVVDGRDFMIYGMNWDYMPIGQNYTYDLWGQPDDVITEILRREMTLLQKMGVNAIRQTSDIPPRWVEHIYRTYGIYTVVNHFVGRYGFIVDGVWRSPIDYQDPHVREVLKADVMAAVDRYQSTPGVLMWLLGNEANYGLFWASAEVEDLPLEKRDEARAEFLYSLYGEIIDGIKAKDQNHPVSIANGDIQYIELIARLCPHLDIMGSNVYRGSSSGDVFEKTRNILHLPFMYTEFGADAYDAKRGREDGYAQAEYLRNQWKEIYLQSWGKGGVGNALGGFVFQWGDGWWKYKQDVNLDVHDTTASWSNGGYPSDYVPGENNMNEEWFGITAKTPSDARGIYESKPRPAYFLLREAFRLEPYAETTTRARIEAHFAALDPEDVAAGHEASRLLSQVEDLSRIRVSSLRLDFETYTTKGRKLGDPDRQRQRFDHQESVYVEVAGEPTAGLSGRLAVNVLGNVAANPIDEIFYENRGGRELVRTVGGTSVELAPLERVKIYQAAFSWKHPYFELEGFHRVGHYHWGYEGDFFGLYRESYQQESVDMYDADSPSGIVVNGKKELEGLTVAFGPQLYWGANPMILGKYWRSFGPLTFALMHQEDLAKGGSAATSSAISEPKTRKSTLYLALTRGALKLEAGGILAGTERIDRTFTSVEEAPAGQPSYLSSGYYVLEDQIRALDTLGGRAKLSYASPVFNWYVQGSYMGLVADGGPDPTLTFTGFSLKESGQGNHYAVSTGGAIALGPIQVAPNMLYQKPLQGPLPKIDDYFDAGTGTYYPAVHLRNQLQDPFWVRSNRETLGLELVLNYDPTPATWLFAWDNIRREDAPFAASLDFVYRIQPTSQDAALGFTEEGVQFAFPQSPPAQDVWEIRARVMANPTRDLHLVGWIWGGTGQANGYDACLIPSATAGTVAEACDPAKGWAPRLVKRFGAQARVAWDRLAVEGYVKVDDWGPYDYYRDFNLTFPLQLMGDVSWAFDMPKWLVVAYNRVGIRGKLRTLDQYSPRYDYDPSNTSALGREWEVKTYVQLSL